MLQTYNPVKTHLCFFFHTTLVKSKLPTVFGLTWWSSEESNSVWTGMSLIEVDIEILAFTTHLIYFELVEECK